MIQIGISLHLEVFCLISSSNRELTMTIIKKGPMLEFIDFKQSNEDLQLHYSKLESSGSSKLRNADVAVKSWQIQIMRKKP